MITALRAAIGSEALSRRVSMRSGGYDIPPSPLSTASWPFPPPAGKSTKRAGFVAAPDLAGNPAEAASTVAAAINRIARALALQRLAGSAAGKPSGWELQVLDCNRAKPQAVAGKPLFRRSRQLWAAGRGGAAPRLAIATSYRSECAIREPNPPM